MICRMSIAKRGPLIGTRRISPAATAAAKAILKTQANPIPSSTPSRVASIMSVSMAIGQPLIPTEARASSTRLRRCVWAGNAMIGHRDISAGSTVGSRAIG
jgi:hypothetical protein